jgi:DNA-binding transcriptional ArsR family regulator
MLADQTLLAAITSPRRREILRLVWRDERSAGDIHRAMPDVTFGAVSLHQRALSDAGLVDMRPESRHRFYRANRDALAPVARILEAMWDDSLARLKAAAEMEAARRGPRSTSRSGRRR